MLRISALACLFAVGSLACGDDTGPGGSGAGGGNGGNPQGGENPGGQAQGAGPQGGNGGSGGIAQGGSGGTGGTAQGGSGGGGGAQPAEAECATDEDCFLNSDCCECAGRPLGEVPPDCSQNCLIDTCTSLGIQNGGNPALAVCAAGRCVVPASCNEGTVTCDQAPPVCAAGSSPIVVGNCYNGQCLPTLECNAVTSCSNCVGAGVSCVVDSAFTQTSHCVDSQGCAGNDCECLGASVCVAPFDACSEVTDHIECGCPVCL